MDATQFLLLCIRAPQAAHVHSSTIAAICGALQLQPPRSSSSLQLQPPWTCKQARVPGAGRPVCVYGERGGRCGAVKPYCMGGVGNDPPQPPAPAQPAGPQGSGDGSKVKKRHTHHTIFK